MDLPILLFWVGNDSFFLYVDCILFIYKSILYLVQVSIIASLRCYDGFHVISSNLKKTKRMSSYCISGGLPMTPPNIAASNTGNDRISYMLFLCQVRLIDIIKSKHKTCNNNCTIDINVRRK